MVYIFFTIVKIKKNKFFSKKIGHKTEGIIFSFITGNHLDVNYYLFIYNFMKCLLQSKCRYRKSNLKTRLC